MSRFLKTADDDGPVPKKKRCLSDGETSAEDKPALLQSIKKEPVLSQEEIDRCRELTKLRKKRSLVGIVVL